MQKGARSRCWRVRSVELALYEVVLLRLELVKEIGGRTD